MDQSHRVCPGDSLELAHRICRPDYTLKGKGRYLRCSIPPWLGLCQGRLPGQRLPGTVGSGQAWRGRTPQYQVCFRIFGVKLGHAIHVFDSRSVLTQFGVNQGPVDQGVNVITLQDDGLPVFSTAFLSSPMFPWTTPRLYQVGAEVGSRETDFSKSASAPCRSSWAWKLPRGWYIEWENQTPDAGRFSSRWRLLHSGPAGHRLNLGSNSRSTTLDRP